MDIQEFAKNLAFILSFGAAVYSVIKRRIEQKKHEYELEDAKKKNATDDMNEHARLYSLIYDDAIRTVERTGAIRCCVDQFHNGDRFNAGNQFFKMSMTVEAVDSEATPHIANKFQAQPWTQFLPQLAVMFNDPMSSLPGVFIKTVTDNTGSQRRFVVMCRDRLRSGVCRELMFRYGVSCWVGTMIIDPISANPMGIVSCHFDDESRIQELNPRCDNPNDCDECPRFRTENIEKIASLGWFADSCAVRIRAMRAKELNDADNQQRKKTSIITRSKTQRLKPIEE